MNSFPIRILLVGKAKDACRIRGLLDTKDSGNFHIAHVSDLDLAAERISTDPTDVLLLDLESNPHRCRESVQAARAAAPDMPMVVLAESEDELLAVDSLRQGAQDFLTKDRLDRNALVRSLRYSIERHRLQKNLHDLSLRDDLTGLYNRRGFMALAEQHLRMLQRKGAALLIYIDLDDLKLINDSHGHLEGNRALIVTANVLRTCFRQSDILARLGGDEFCVLMTDAGQDSAEQVRKRLQARIDFINGLSSWNFRISLSVGIADVPTILQPPLDQLLRIADTQMYEEKRKKRMRGSESPALKQSTVA
ncbi:MAG TPA: diguanylate cyclase response regulator [Candidatus Acidoferrales bacterium]|jgi:diguanylate cyclase (GGDEF)-like protein|nr:diguanylate cyclase response regulator [Candidatus Acidoferrales bacterium]